MILLVVVGLLSFLLGASYVWQAKLEHFMPRPSGAVCTQLNADGTITITTPVHVGERHGTLTVIVDRTSTESLRLQLNDVRERTHRTVGMS
jgi:hypothetical protein